jgi:hypothetical protein
VIDGAVRGRRQPVSSVEVLGTVQLLGVIARSNTTPPLASASKLGARSAIAPPKSGSTSARSVSIWISSTEGRRAEARRRGTSVVRRRSGSLKATRGCSARTLQSW